MRSAVSTNRLSIRNDYPIEWGKVKHAKFGTGTIINIEGSENNTRLQIAFQGRGIKWLIASLAKLKKLF